MVLLNCAQPFPVVAGGPPHGSIFDSFFGVNFCFLDDVSFFERNGSLFVVPLFDV
jgi:hypothetical protein